MKTNTDILKAGKTYLAFYKADGPTAKAWDKIVAKWTRGPYSHVEVIFFEDGKWRQFSSSPRDKGVRIKPHVIDPRKWDYREIRFYDWDTARECMNELLGLRYDWAGILGFVLPYQDREDKWFCSEACSNLMKIDGQPALWKLDPSRVSPNRLWRIIDGRNLAV